MCELTFHQTYRDVEHTGVRADVRDQDSRNSHHRPAAVLELRLLVVGKGTLRGSEAKRVETVVAGNRLSSEVGRGLATGLPVPSGGLDGDRGLPGGALQVS